jgi:teichuronic acid biosynthesis glycosyltransferase TuaG
VPEPKFSIVLPVYNSSSFLRQCIDSVISQSFSNWELLIVDDGSVDNSFQISHSYSFLDPRIKCFQNEFEKGASGARNTAIKQAQGQFISFLDSDDMWGPDHLQYQYQSFCQGCVLVHSSHYLIDEAGARLGYVKAPIRVNAIMILCFNFLPQLTVSYDTHFFGKCYLPNIKSRNDYALWLQLFSSHSGLVSCNCGFTKCSYRKVSNSLSKASILSNISKYLEVVSLYYPPFIFPLILPVYLSLMCLKKVIPRLYNQIIKLLDLLLN